MIGKGLGIPWLFLAASLARAGEPDAPAMSQAPFRDFEEIPIESVLDVKVVTAARHEQGLEDAPASVTVITAAEIAAYGYETLAEALRGLAGLHVTNDRNYEYLGVRGFSPPGDYNTRVLFLVDGHPMNEIAWAAGYIGTDGPIDLDLVERIEVVRGPGSVLYGTNAIFGVVQIITRDGAHPTGIATRGGIGSFGRREGLASFSGPLGRAATVEVAVSGLDVDGPNLLFPEFAADGRDGWTSGTDGDRNRRVLAGLTAGRFRAQALYSDRTKWIPTAPWDVLFDDGATRTTDSRGYVEAGYEFTPRPILRLHLRGYADWSGYSGTWPYEVAEDSAAAPERILGRDRSESLWFGAEGRAAWDPGGAHHLLAGLEIRRDRITIRNWYDYPASGATDETLDATHRAFFSALYLQEEFTPRPWISVTTGAHYDRYDSFGGIVTPRLTFVVEPWAGTKLKLLHGEGFKAPSRGELDYGDGVTQIPSPDLEPERVQSEEIVLDHVLSRKLWVRLSGYENRIHDVISLVERDEDGLLQYQNAGHARVRGVEGELRAALPSGLTARGSVSFQNSRDLVAGGGLVNAPRWLASTGAIVPAFGRRLTCAIEGRYVGERRGTQPGSRAGAYVVLDAGANARLPFPGWTVGLKVSNIGDNAYADPAGEEHAMPLIRQDGRTWRLAVRYRTARSSAGA